MILFAESTSCVFICSSFPYPFITSSHSGLRCPGDEMCQAFLSIYPVPDWEIGCTIDLADSAVNNWLDDAYDAGLWDMNHNGWTIESLMENGIISDPSDVHPRVWEQYGGHWNKEHEDAATFYDKLWNDPSYGERLSLCSGNIITFEEEYGEFEEYCMDSCLCVEQNSYQKRIEMEQGENKEETKASHGLAIWKIAVIVVAAVAAVCLFGIAFCFCVARQLSKESVPQNDNDYIALSVIQES